jgi:uncharacterized YccA/Bax inhibitor family protein
MAELRSSNPVFTNAPRPTWGPVATPTPGELETMYAAPARLTYEDVILHTGGLLVLLALTGAVGWTISSDGNPGIAIAAGLVALGLGWWASMSARVRPAVILAYTALEGVFVGAISHAYETRTHGVIGQALLGTAAIFLVMLGLHKSGRLRATPRMQRIVFGVLLGVVALSLIDLLLYGFGGRVPLLNDHTPLGVIVSLVILGVASLQFTLDFAWVEESVKRGAPRQEAWRLSFGLVVSFVWVYLELLRLLDKIRS